MRSHSNIPVGNASSGKIDKCHAVGDQCHSAPLTSFEIRQCRLAKSQEKMSIATKVVAKFDGGAQ